MPLDDYISVDPAICHGKPCFKGTRIMVATVLELLESGAGLADIRKAYPGLTRQHVQAALHVAHRVLDQGRFTAFHATAR